MAILRPTTEVSNIGWVLNGGANYATLLSDESNTTYVSQNSAAGADLTVGLAPGTDPLVDTGFTVYIRARRTGTDAELAVTLRQGATLIKTGTVTIGASFSDLSIALSSGEASAITNFSTLRIQLDSGGGDIGGQTYVSEVWLELPDLSSGGATIVSDGPIELHSRLYDLPFSHAPGQSREGRIISSGTIDTPNTFVMAAKPTSMSDANGGQICSFTGDWYPASRVVWVGGLPYGDDVAPKDPEFTVWPFDF